MDKFLHSRLFRCLICLLLICCILVNCSPIRAKASAIVAGLTVYEVLGYLALILGTTVGAVYTVDNIKQIISIGMQIEVGEEDLQRGVELTNNINGMWDPSDGSDYDPRLGTKLARGLLTAVAGTIVSSIIAGNMEAEVEEEVEVEIPEGFASYNGHMLPVFTDVDTYPNYYIYLYNGVYKLEARGSHIDVYDDGYESAYWEYYPDRYSISMYASYDPSSGKTSWTKGGSGHVTGGTGINKDSLIYSSCDIHIYDQDYIDGKYVYTDTGTLFISGSSPITSDYTTTEKKTITIDPIYVGDLPTQIENGDLDEEESKDKILAPLPDYIDITKVIKSPETAVEDLTQWQQQVVDNQKTLEEALEDITGELEDIKDNTDSSDSSTPSDPPMVTPPPLVSGYVPHPLDMRNFFPFCIPFDLYDFFTVLAAEPEAPKFHWEIQDLSGHAYAIDIDLKSWDPVAELFRKFQLLLFITGLAAATRKFIKW